MSMVHRQRAVLLQFPLVIYLAALLKCSCRWHWLTNQTVKPHPEYQRKYGLKIFTICFWTMSCTNQLDEIDCFFVVYKSRIFFFTFDSSKVLNLEEKHCCGWQESTPLFTFVGTANQHPHKSSSALAFIEMSLLQIGSRGSIHLCVTAAWIILRVFVWCLLFLIFWHSSTQMLLLLLTWPPFCLCIIQYSSSVRPLDAFKFT